MGLVDIHESQSTSRVRLAQSIVDKVDTKFQEIYNNFMMEAEALPNMIINPDDVVETVLPYIQELRNVYGSTLFNAEFDGSGHILEDEYRLAMNSIKTKGSNIPSDDRHQSRFDNYNINQPNEKVMSTSATPNNMYDNQEDEFEPTLINSTMQHSSEHNTDDNDETNFDTTILKSTRNVWGSNNDQNTTSMKTDVTELEATTIANTPSALVSSSTISRNIDDNDIVDIESITLTKQTISKNGTNSVFNNRNSIQSSGTVSSMVNSMESKTETNTLGHASSNIHLHCNNTSTMNKVGTPSSSASISTSRPPQSADWMNALNGLF